MNILNRNTLGKFYEITDYKNWKKLNIKYWIEFSKNRYSNVVLF